jgi:hypothetical protein
LLLGVSLYRMIQNGASQKNFHQQLLQNILMYKYNKSKTILSHYISFPLNGLLL